MLEENDALGAGGNPVEDMQAHLEKLLGDASEFKLISDLTTDIDKQSLFAA
ncbi:MAG: hypothetical protein V7634_3 [Bradyrhizobium sp.]|jgi:hypothetical protein